MTSLSSTGLDMSVHPAADRSRGYVDPAENHRLMISSGYGSVGGGKAQHIGTDEKDCPDKPMKVMGMYLRENNWIQIFLGSLAEFLGLFFLIVIGGATAIWTGLSVVPTAFAFGVGLMFVMIIFGVFSGAHFNPGVTIGLTIFGQIDWVTMIFYIIAQTLASFAAAGFLLLIFSGTPGGISGAANVVDPAATGFFSAGNAFVAEIIGGWLFMWSVFRLSYHRVGFALSALFLGFGLAGLHLFAIGISGASFNILRTLGIAVVSGTYNPIVASSWWIYPVGWLVAGALAIVSEAFLRWLHDLAIRQDVARAVASTA